MTFAERIRALDKAATQGRLVADPNPDVFDTEFEVCVDVGGNSRDLIATFPTGVHQPGVVKPDHVAHANAALYVHLRNAAPQIAALVEAVEAYRDAHESIGATSEHLDTLFAALAALPKE